MKVIIKPLFLFLLFVNVSRSGQGQSMDSLDIKIGQMILIGMPQAEVDSAVLEEVRSGKVGALIYFEKNIPKSASAFTAFKKMSWAYQKAAPIPLFICIDQEGGKVNRLKEKYGFPRSITAAAIGKFKSLDSVQFYAEATAATLAGLGINVNFAPCVDLAINPTNPVIVKSERSYSANADTVILYAREVVKQHRKYGVVTALKHFPGHGSSKDDTHLGLADVTTTWEDRELKPYQVLIGSGYADAVMTSHIVNRHLDSTALPGTLSKPILDHMLRKKVGVQGVVFTDDMQMKAIANNYGLEEAIRLAVNAGVDIMCFSNNIQGVQVRTVDKVHAIIKSFVATGAIPKSRIDESFNRIMKLKGSLSTKFDEIKSLMTEIQQMKLAQQRAVEAAKKAVEAALQNMETQQKRSKKRKTKS